MGAQSIDSLVEVFAGYTSTKRVKVRFCELVRRQILFQHSSVSTETVSASVAGQLSFLGLQLLQVFLPELQVLLSLLAFDSQLVNRLFACHVITSFLVSGHNKSSRLFTVESL